MEKSIETKRKIDIHKSAGIIIKDRRLLITRSKGKSFFISPGGKIESGEDKFTALKRELYEELQINVDISDLKNLDTFYAPAQGQEDKYVQIDVLIVNNWEGQSIPSSEIEEVIWVDSKSSLNIELGSVFKHNVIPALKKLDLID